MSLTLFGNDKINDDLDINKPLGRVGHSLHLYYELTESDKNDNPKKDNEKEDIFKNDYTALNYSEDNENKKPCCNSLSQENIKFENTDGWNEIKQNDENGIKNDGGNNTSNRGYNKFIQGEYKLVLFGGGLIDNEFVKNYSSEYTMNSDEYNMHNNMYNNVHNNVHNNLYDKNPDNNFKNYNTLSIERYLSQTFNDTYICEENNNSMDSWFRIKTYNTPKARAFHASSIVNLGINGVFLFIHGGKFKNDVLSSNSLYALNLSKLSFDDNTNCSNIRNGAYEYGDSDGANQGSNAEKSSYRNGQIYTSDEANAFNEEENNSADDSRNYYTNENDNQNDQPLSSSNLDNNIIKKKKKKKKKKNQDNSKLSNQQESESSYESYTSNSNTVLSDSSLVSSSSSSNCGSEYEPNIYHSNFYRDKMDNNGNCINANNIDENNNNDCADTLVNFRGPAKSLLLKNNSDSYNDSYEDGENMVPYCKNVKREWIKINTIGEKPSKRYGHTLDFIYPYLILFGGNEKIDDEENTFCKNDLWILNITKSKIKKKKKKKTNSNNTDPFTNDESNEKDVLVFMWEEIKYVPVDPLGRYFHATTVWYDKVSKKNKLILYGGKMKNDDKANNRGAYTNGANNNRLFILENIGEQNCQWSILPIYLDTINESRAYHSIVCVQNYIFIMGGEEYKYTEKVPSALYSFESKKFQYINDFTSRILLKSYVKDNNIYSWGGFSSVPTSNNNYFPNKFIIIDINPHILCIQMKESLGDEYDENSSVITKADEDSDDNMYNKINKNFIRIEKKKGQLEKDILYQVKLNNNMEFRIKSQMIQYQRLVQLYNLKQRQIYNYMALLKRNGEEGMPIDGTDTYGNEYTLGNLGVGMNNLMENYSIYNNCSGNENIGIPINTNMTLQNDINIEYGFNAMPMEGMGAGLLNQPVNEDINNYKNCEKMQSIPYTNSTNEKSKNDEQEGQQFIYENENGVPINNLMDTKNHENYYNMELKDNLLNNQKGDELKQGNIQNYYDTNMMYNIDKNCSITNDGQFYYYPNDNNMLDKINWKQNLINVDTSANIAINPNSQERLNIHENELKSVNQNLLLPTNLTDINMPSNNNSQNNPIKYEQSQNAAEINGGETVVKKEVPPQRARRKTAQKCMELIEQDMLIRKMNEK
ncbi:conserved Plasmodium protein, unknown function [Plasmodium chabaudi chabaudi]|uniref:Kelch domain-containing protein n=1 Tax=Plasmodium chabaudi chabaudi TaxID=31271 RepID=A0A1D3RS48_PLACU|nr:conserved Plasmodium protein, unknown function [Plasmodium chabaudi chabaudi]